jgi:hypothetical protein
MTSQCDRRCKVWSQMFQSASLFQNEPMRVALYLREYEQCMRRCLSVD